MNILLDRTPKSVLLAGHEVKISSDFRIGIRFEILMDSNKSDIEKVNKALELYYGYVPDAVSEAIDQMLWFFRCGETSNETKKGKQSMKRLYSYEYDQYLIYTAFLYYYGIDLSNIKYLHWWKFKKMFTELPEDSQMKKAMLFRTIRISSDMSIEQRKYYAEMKRIYALPEVTNITHKANAFANILANGMKLPDREVES